MAENRTQRLEYASYDTPGRGLPTTKLIQVIVCTFPIWGILVFFLLYMIGTSFFRH
jgi:hypothetical protein